MPSTESRSRDEWLAEVRRRGERIRRRRRYTIALLTAFAVVLPMSAVAGFLTATPGRDVELTAAGRAPGAQPHPTASTNDTGTESDVVDTTVPSSAGALVGAAEPLATAAALPTTTVAVSRSSPVGDVPAEPARPPTSVAPADDPVVRSPATTTPPPTGRGGATNSASNSGGAAAARPVDSDPAVTACLGPGIRVTVVTDKAVYAPGEVVSGSSTLENSSDTTCLVPTRAFFRIEDGAGKVVGSFAYTMEFRLPVKAEPGKTFISGFSWDQKDCSWSTCAQVPAGTYMAIADWTEGGQHTGVVTFQVSA